MKLFGRSGGYYLFWTSALYLVIGLIDIFFIQADLSPQIQIAWLSVLVAPFVIPPWGRWFNLDINWDRKMLDWLKKKPSNVIPFPEQKEITEFGSGGYLPPEPKKPAVTYYTLGLTSENRLEFKMGHSAITMNHDGLVNLMEQLEVFRKQLADYEGKEENV